MKYLVILGDGMADYPLDELSGMTPLEYADTPNIDFIASKGSRGLLRTVPRGMEPGSEIANLSILGYNPHIYFTGRGPLEAAGLHVNLSENDVALRMNLVTVHRDKLSDHSAGHIATEEAKELIDLLKGEVESNDINFYLGISYRHILVLRGNHSAKIKTTPPHNVVGAKISEILVEPLDKDAKETADTLNDLVLSSKEILPNGYLIWPWSPGFPPRMPDFKRKYGVSGAMVAEIPLIKGIGVHAGMDIMDVPGATGYYDTNYEAIAAYTVKAMEDHDFVYVHIEAPDEAGHAGDPEKKVETIEDLDKRLVGPTLDKLDFECRVAVLPDHPTPVQIRKHTTDPVPFFVYPRKEIAGILQPNEFIDSFIQ